ncbi:hypothetical protein, partial [Thiolapillus sp.]|uniref:hypothetical protein n=1 Tax=Thiolapillus sp. TaxID=2017437 RepID=UPI003AF4FBD2
RSEAYFVFPLAQGTPGKQCGLAATGDYQPSLRSPWLAAGGLTLKPCEARTISQTADIRIESLVQYEMSLKVGRISSMR